MAIMDTAGAAVKIGATTIGRTKNVRTNGGSRPQRDQTDLSHTDYRRIGRGLKGPGSISFEMILDAADTGQIALQAAYVNGGTNYSFSFTWPGPVVETLSNAFVESIERNADVDADGTATVTLTGNLSGWPTS